MSYKKWVISEIDKNAATRLAEECDIDPLVALIAQSRGYTDPYELEEFLSDDPIFADIYEMPDILKAAQIINESISNGEYICVYGDYDCDGVTSTALLYGYLLERNVRATYYIPDRFAEGYGMSNEVIDELKGKGVNLIITVDNGISCVDEIAYAESLGIKTVVTDHHLPPEILPDAAAIVNPHLKNSMVEFPEICGVFVAFKLVCAIENRQPEELLYKYADLVALGTIADVMPLKNENRDIVKCGVKLLNAKPRNGFLALINAAGLSKGAVTASKIAFGMAPRINAAGRMGNADIAVKLLLETDFMAASDFAAELDKLNAQRQQTEQNILSSAVKIIEEQKLEFDRVIVVCGNNWHKGVVGIVAARIVEKYGKPAIVLSCDENGNVSGSGRSLNGFSLYDALLNCQGLLIRFGGHENAAGVKLTQDNLDAFRKAINEYAAKLPLVISELRIDCKLNCAGLSLDLAEAIKTLEPFGMGNPIPLFALCSMKLERIISLSNNKHCKLLLSKNGKTVETVVFGCAVEAVPFSVGDIIDIAITVDINEYMGRKNLSVVIKNWRLSDLNEAQLFDEIETYSAFCRKDKLNYPDVSRNDVAAVYRAIDDNTVEAVRQKLIKTLGYFKTNMALDVLRELDLIVDKNDGGVIKLHKNSGKTADLNNSLILRTLRGDNRD